MRTPRRDSVWALVSFRAERKNSRLLPCPGGGLFQFFGVRLLPLALPETCGFSLALLPEQSGFHRVEGFKETLLPCGGFLAGEAHREEGEAVAGEPVGGIFSDTYV